MDDLNTEHNAEIDIDLPKGSSALVMDDNGWNLFIPNLNDDDDLAPVHSIFLTAVAIRFNSDPKWVDDMMEWMKHQVEGEDGFDDQ